MAGIISFSRDYASFGSLVRPFEKADDIGSVITEFLWYQGEPFYPVSALLCAKVSSVWLGQGEPSSVDEDNLDLVFKMRESDGGSFFEIVLRSSYGTSYGGWGWGQRLEITDELVCGHRVLVVHANNRKIKLVYSSSENVYLHDEVIGHSDPEETSVVDFSNNRKERMEKRFFLDVNKVYL